MRVVITGSDGLVGAACVRGFSSRGDLVVALPHSALDIEDRAKVDVLMKAQPVHAVVCAAARPHVEGCERDPAETRRVNVDATVHLAQTAEKVGAAFVAFSSEYVFDGTADRPYVEDDLRNPINEYGRQKRDLEDALGKLPGALVVRTSGVYGLESQRKNFVYQLVDRVGAGQRVCVPDDQLITPTCADNLGDLVAHAIECGVRGVLHLTGPQPMSRVAFAQLVATAFDLDDDALVPCPTATLHLLARRPPRAALSADKALGLGLSPLVSAQEGLARMRASLTRGSHNESSRRHVV
jgi:dTDP-4-dehydrorhamnose reductase